MTPAGPAAGPESLLAGVLTTDPARPLLTYYDDATGERTELSATTLANWVAKAANLLQDELDVESGTAVGVALPSHWQTAAILLAAWSVGAVLSPDVSRPDVACVDAAHLDAAAGAGTRLAFALGPLGGGFAVPPPGAIDFAADVRGQPDGFAPHAPVEGGQLALAAPPTSRAELVAAAVDVAGRLGFDAGDRVLDLRRWAGPPAWIDGLLAPLAAGASVVLAPAMAASDAALVEARAAAERVTHVHDGTGVRRLR